MKRLEKIFEDINIQLKEEKLKYRKLKICKYSFEINKICILLLSTGLSFINAFAIISLMIDGDKKVVSKQPSVSFPKVNSLQS